MNEDQGEERFEDDGCYDFVDEEMGFRGFKFACDDRIEPQIP